MLAALSSGGCVYYNTFYNARKAFDSAESKRKQAEQKGRPVNAGSYRTAIEKSLKVIENYPNSRYYDDALYVLAISYYYTGQYAKSERRFREILANYGDTKFARDATLYLAKSKLEQDDLGDAMDLFRDIFAADVDRSFKAQAAMALGEYYFNQQEYRQSEEFLRAVRDSLGADQERIKAQMYIADGLYARYQFRDAQGAYLQLLGMDPSTDDRFHSLFHAASCSYQIQKIDEGMDYLQTLADDPLYFDSLGVLKLKIAEGYELDDDLSPAEAIFEEVINTVENRRQQAQAHYRLGLIYQFDYDDLSRAKEQYDEVTKIARTTDIGQDALQRSTDIGKLEVYARSIEFDSTTTQVDIDDAALTQYLLSELYWFKLNKPDTAIMEMQYLVDSFSTSYDAPKAMLALSQMIREHRGDSVTADSILSNAIARFPGSDYMPSLLEAAGMSNTAADTGYAERYLDQAEYFLVDEFDLDSARANYQYIVDNYPDSRFYLQARFGLIWLTEMYDSPGDSSVFFAYEEFADSFPGSPWATVARTRLGTTQRQIRPLPQQQEQAVDSSDTGVIATSPTDEGDTGGERSLIGIYDDLYVDQDGNPIFDLWDGVELTEVIEEFLYPQEAYRFEFPGDVLEMYFQIKLDFDGRVVDLVLKRTSGNSFIDVEATKIVASMTFDPLLIPQEMQDSWWVYKYTVERPEHLR
ncbi:MAG: tetratricopeptide repeat protein [Candidatus Zixiibacteriota bacterium]